jgi:uncharacterized repeat protein (TIGR03833 family)
MMPENDDEGKYLDNIKVGLAVEIFLKEDRSGKNPVWGIVSEILTHSSFHPHGIMVRLMDGNIGRVQKIFSKIEKISGQQNQPPNIQQKLYQRDPQNNSEKIQQFLLEEGEAYCDDCLSELLSIFPRQTINQICRTLESKKIITRQRGTCNSCGKGKIVNYSGEDRLSSQHPASSEGTQKDKVIDFIELVKNGENEFVEFKSSSLWSKKYTEEECKTIAPPIVRKFGRDASKVIIAKSIAGFLNTDGGHLIIGIKENKSKSPDEIIGTESEYDKLEDQCPDGYRRMLVDEIIRKYFHPDIYNHFSNYLKITFPEINDKILCWIQILKSDVPAFLTIRGTEYFFIRVDAETRELDGKQMVEYCGKRFVKKIN